MKEPTATRPSMPGAFDQNHDPLPLSSSSRPYAPDIKLAITLNNTGSAIGALAFVGDVLSRARTYFEDAAQKASRMSKYLPKPGKFIMQGLAKVPPTTPAYGVVGLFTVASHLAERNAEKTPTKLDHVRDAAAIAGIPTGVIAAASVTLKFTPAWRMVSEAAVIASYSAIRIPNGMEKQQHDITNEKDTPGKEDRAKMRSSDQFIWASLASAYAFDGLRKFGVASGKFGIAQEVVTASFIGASLATEYSALRSAQSKYKDGELAKDFAKNPVLRPLQTVAAANGGVIAMMLIPTVIQHRLKTGTSIKQNPLLNLGEITMMQQSALARASSWKIHLDKKEAALPKEEKRPPAEGSFASRITTERIDNYMKYHFIG